MQTYWLVGDKDDDQIKLKVSRVENEVRHDQRKRLSQQNTQVQVFGFFFVFQIK
jgi:hypothetical protein